MKDPQYLRAIFQAYNTEEMFMKRQVPLVLCFLFGIVMCFTQFSPHSFSQSIYDEVVYWALIMSPFALAVGTITLIQTHVIRIRPAPYRALAIQFCCLCWAADNGSDRTSIWVRNTRRLPGYSTTFKYHWMLRCFRSLLF